MWNGFSSLPNYLGGKRRLCELIEDFSYTPTVVSLEHRWSIATTEDHYEQGAKELLIIARRN